MSPGTCLREDSHAFGMCSHKTSFIGVLEHISGRCIRFRTKMGVALIMRARESTSIVVIFAGNGLVLNRKDQVAGKGCWIRVVMPHWKHCNC